MRPGKASAIVFVSFKSLWAVPGLITFYFFPKLDVARVPERG